MSRAIPLSRHEEWRAALHGLDHAFAHTWEHCRAMALTSGWPTFLYVFENAGTRTVCPFAERPFGDALDVVTPYGFSGFAGTADPDDVLQAWCDFASTRGYVCGYIGLNPALDPTGAWRTRAEAHNDVYLLDLTGSEDVLLARMSANRRRVISAWRLRERPCVEDREELVSFFIAHYHRFVAARGAAPVYDFTKATLEYLLGLDDVVVIGVGEDARLEAVAVFGHTHAVGDYLFGVSVPGGERHSAVLVWEGALALRRRRVPVLNLGGGVHAGDGVAEFKRRFGATPEPLRRLRHVYDPDRFAALCRAAGRDPNDRSGYFPPYRAG